MSNTEANCQTYSDLYKDVHGFRPSLVRFRALSETEQGAEINRLSETLREILDDESPAPRVDILHPMFWEDLEN